MANTLSAAKNARKAIKRHAARVSVKSKLRTLRKKTLLLATENKNPEEINATLKATIKGFDKAASNGYIHFKTASRKIGRLMKHVHKLSLGKT